MTFWQNNLNQDVQISRIPGYKGSNEATKELSFGRNSTYEGTPVAADSWKYRFVNIERHPRQTAYSDDAASVAK